MTPASSTDCIFCKIAAGTIPAHRLYDDDDTLAFADLNPQAPAHLLVIPKEHLTSLAHATPDHQQLLGKLLSTAAEVARQQGLDNGYRIIITGSDLRPDGLPSALSHVLGKRATHWPPG